MNRHDIKRVALLLIISMAMAFIIGCSSDKKAWEDAGKADTIESYQEFIQENPKSQFIRDARTKIEGKNWEKAQKIDTVKAYEEFTKEYPNHPEKANIEKRIAQLKEEEKKAIEKRIAQLKEEEKKAYELAKEEDNTESWKSFISKYPGCKNKKAIEKRIHRLASLKKIPLVIQRLSSIFGRSKDKEILDGKTKWSAGNDGKIVARGARISGKNSGYEFTPIRYLKFGETPRDVISSLAEKSDYVLLVRVRSNATELTTYKNYREGEIDRIFNIPFGLIAGDARLYQTKNLKVLFSQEFYLNTSERNLSKIINMKMNSNKKFYLNIATEEFSRGFDLNIMEKMHETMQPKDIYDAFDKVKKTSKFATINPSLSDISVNSVVSIYTGIPSKGRLLSLIYMIYPYSSSSRHENGQIKIETSDSQGKGIVYLKNTKNGKIRRWFLDSDQPIHVDIKPGNYAIYIEIKSKNIIYRGNLNAENRKLYTYKIK